MRPSYKLKMWQQREHDILLTAARLVRERGYANFSMDELAEAVGVSKPTLYQHFKSKDDLGAEVLIRSLGTMEELLQSSGQGRAIERLEMALRRLLQKRYSSESIIAHTGPEIFMLLRGHPALMNHRRQIFQHLYALITEAQAVGDIVDDIPAPIIANVMFGMLGSLAKHFMPPDVDIGVENLDQAIEWVIRLFMQGIRPVTSS